MPYTITWTVDDIKEIRPDWSEERCELALDIMWKRLEEASITAGFNFIENNVDWYAELGEK